MINDILEVKSSILRS